MSFGVVALFDDWCVVVEQEANLLTFAEFDFSLLATLVVNDDVFELEGLKDLAEQPVQVLKGLARLLSGVDAAEGADVEQDVVGTLQPPQQKSNLMFVGFKLNVQNVVEVYRCPSFASPWILSKIYRDVFGLLRGLLVVRLLFGDV